MISPFLIFFLAGGLLFFVKDPRLRGLVLLGAPVLGLWNLMGFPMGEVVQGTFLGQELVLTRVDRLSWLFGLLFHIAAFLGGLFLLHERDTLQDTASLFYAGSAIGAVFAGDLLTFLIFCEFLACTSVLLIFARDTISSTAAGVRYLIFHLLSGALLLFGAVAHFYETGSLTFGYLGLQGLGPWLIFFALGIKAAFPFFHTWLTDAYPEATPGGIVFLSAFTTKVAVYAFARGYPGTDLLLYIGFVMAIFPIFYALIANDLRKVLCYSLINQVGFMICGIGVGSALAMNGAIAHAFNDVISKGLLFMSMGAVLFRTGRVNATDLGGLYRSMPWTAGFCLIGAASLSAIPLFSGFISKSMILLAVLKAGHPVVWMGLLFAFSGVLHYTGIKVPYRTFFSQDRGIRCEEAPSNMLIAMGLAGFICIFNGLYPWVLYDLLPYPVDYNPFTAEHVLVQLQLLLFSVLSFFLFNRRSLGIPQVLGIHLDADWLYRKGFPDLSRWYLKKISSFDEFLLGCVKRVAEGFFALVYRYHGPESMIVRSWSTGIMVLWALCLLGVYIFLSLLSFSMVGLL